MPADSAAHLPPDALEEIADQCRSARIEPGASRETAVDRRSGVRTIALCLSERGLGEFEIG